MESDAILKQQDQGELLKQLLLLKNELAKKQRKLKKARRSENAKEYVRRKLAEQDKLKREEQSQNDFSKFSLTEKSVSRSSTSTFNLSGEESGIHINTSETNSKKCIDLTVNCEDDKAIELMSSVQSQSNVITENEKTYNKRKFTETENNSISLSSPEVNIKDEENIQIKAKEKSLLKTKFDLMLRSSHCYNPKTVEENQENTTFSQKISSPTSEAVTECLSSNSEIIVPTNNADFRCPVVSDDENIIKLKNKTEYTNTFLTDSLAITPSFVSMKTQLDGYGLQNDSSQKHWYIESQNEDTNLQLNLHSETQYTDDFVKSQTLHSKDKPSPEIPSVQNNDNLTSTNKYLDVTTEKSDDIHFQSISHDTDNKSGQIKCLVQSQTLAVPQDMQEKHLADKTNETENVKTFISPTKERENRFSISEEIEIISSPESNRNNPLVSGNKNLECNESHLVNNSCNQHMLLDQKFSDCSHRRDTVFSSLPSNSEESKSVLVRRKRRRSNSFSDFKCKKKMKMLNLAKGINFRRTVSDRNISDEGFMVLKDIKNSDQVCNIKTLDTQSSVSSQITVVQGNGNESPHFESQDSDTSESISSQSLLKPVVSCKDKSRNPEQTNTKTFEEGKSSILSIQHNISDADLILKCGLKDSAKRVCTQTVDYLENDDNKTSQNIVSCEQHSQICNFNHEKTKLLCSEDTINSLEQHKSQEQKKIENNPSFTDHVDVIPSSQMELSQSFLSDQEAHKSECLKISSRRRKRQPGIFIPRKSPRITSPSTGNVRCGPNSPIASSTSSCDSNSTGFSSQSEHQIMRRTYRSRKALIISSLFQFLVDEAKRQKNKEEFFLPEIQFDYLLHEKCRKGFQAEVSELDMKHLLNVQNQNPGQECSEELYSQDLLNEDKLDFPFNVAEEANHLIDSSENIPTINHQNQGNVFPDKTSSAEDEVFEKEIICSKDRKLSQTVLTGDDHPADTSSEEPGKLIPSCPPNTETSTNITPSSTSEQNIATATGCKDSKHTSETNEFSILSPNRGSFLGDAALPNDGLSAESSAETCLSSQSISETLSDTYEPNCTTKHTDVQGKGCIRHLSSFQIGKDEPVISVISSIVRSSNIDIMFVACISEYTLSLWTADEKNDWNNELDWLLPLGCCAEKLCLLPHKTKSALLISGRKDEMFPWVLLFVYDMQSGETSRLTIEFPITNFTKNRLLCCPLKYDQIIISYGQSSTTILQKHSFSEDLNEVQSQQKLENTKENLLSLSTVEDLDLALVGLSSNSNILVWNHEVGSLLTQIDISQIFPSPLSISSVQSVEGFLFLLVMNRHKQNPGSFLAVNPSTQMFKLLFHFDGHNEKMQSFKNPVVNEKIMAAIDEEGDVLLWDKYYGNLLAYLPQSHSTSLHLSKCHLIAGQENGCVHVMEIR